MLNTGPPLSQLVPLKSASGPKTRHNGELIQLANQIYSKPVHISYDPSELTVVVLHKN